MKHFKREAILMVALPVALIALGVLAAWLLPNLLP